MIYMIANKDLLHDLFFLFYAYLYENYFVSIELSTINLLAFLKIQCHEDTMVAKVSGIRFEKKNIKKICKHFYFLEFLFLIL